MEIELLLGPLIAAVGGKLAYDVLGPTAKYMGGELKDLTEAGLQNVRRVFEKAKMTADSLSIKGGAVPPRTLLPVLQSAYFCEDELVAAYLGGVLCSSRSPVSRDDRAVRVLRMIDGLSTYALRIHFIIYASVLRQKNYQMAELRKWLMKGYGVTVLFNESDLRSKMEFSDLEDADGAMEHAFISLSAHDLCSKGFNPVKFDSGEIVRWLRLSIRGIELFCWGNGFGQLGINPYFANAVSNETTKSLGVDPIKVDLGLVSYG